MLLKVDNQIINTDLIEQASYSPAGYVAFDETKPYEIDRKTGMYAYKESGDVIGKFNQPRLEIYFTGGYSEGFNNGYCEFTGFMAVQFWNMLVWNSESVSPDDAEEINERQNEIMSEAYHQKKLAGDHYANRVQNS